ncbi:hypothetical protein CTEN210_14072 [Chaetoceros tenuissimus]|uniref:Uncharacterized protein n=1 Tax=Chaetoceros tenuissimus TaxID=426638 RepID=A0AAD3D494_9STRA|nr:hypothetical protein CTEN210_14072 [Chaetoceros tenuissimus]
MKSFRTSLFFLLSCSTVAAELERPELIPQATRVKQHFHRSGELVEGEEDLLKLILSWKPHRSAESYEICHNCLDLIDESGIEKANTASKVVKSTGNYGGYPSIVMPAITKGVQYFHLKYSSASGEQSSWSKALKLSVEEPGQATIIHDEL